jgi:glycosyltransferase involved in cell wall biosynthesis
LAARPYFVAVGTIEPRKNHLLLLNAWREMAQGVGPTPRLVIVGERGWENEQVVDMLERCPGIADRVWETHGRSDAGLRRLIANARGLLAPSFAEGFGLPLIEALGLGAPTVASDIPIFHEVAGEAAIFRSPIDGVGWREAILALADADSGLSREARSRAASFRGASADGYFETVREFLAGL